MNEFCPLHKGILSPYHQITRRLKLIDQFFHKSRRSFNLTPFQMNNLASDPFITLNSPLN